MSSAGSGNYGKFEVVRGDLYAKRIPPNRQPVTSSFTTAEFDLDRDMMGLFAALEGEDGTVPSRGIQEVREGRQRPWRYIAKRFAEALDAGVSVPAIYEITHRLNQYVAARAARRSQPHRGRAA